MRQTEIMELHHQPTANQFNKAKELLELCVIPVVFLFDDLLIRGNPAFIVKEYVVKNPSKSFRQWLIDSPYYIQELEL